VLFINQLVWKTPTDLSTHLSNLGFDILLSLQEIALSEFKNYIWYKIISNVICIFVSFQ